MRREGYRRGLRAAVAASAAPYGYTVTVWTSGAILVDARGLPSTWEAAAFMAGAVAGFALVGALAVGGVRKPFLAEPRPVALWRSFHLASIGAAIAAATAIAHLVQNPVAWPLGGFFATTIYLAVVGLQLTIGS